MPVNSSLSESSPSSGPSCTTLSQSSQLYADGPMYFKCRAITQDYEISEAVLGEGVSGQVRTASRKSGSQQAGLKYAVKTMKMEGATEDTLEGMRKEVESLMKMDHPNIVFLLDVYEADGNLNLVMECLEGLDLCDKYNEVGRFSEEEAAYAIWQMMLAVNYVHLQGVVHRDVKLEHFMYETKESKHLKLIDFGLSDRWEESKSLMDKTVGTLGWVAPEVLKKCYTSKCDVWGLGCIAFTLLLGFTPFPSEPSKETFHSIMKGEYVKKDGMWDWVSSEAGDFIRQLLDIDANKRPSVCQALKHPWITQWNFEKIEKNVVTAENVLDALETWTQAPAQTKFCMQRAARCLPKERQKKFRDMFLALDADKNGRLSWDEFICQAPEILDIDAPRVFAELKTNGKDSDELHYTDFLAAMLAKTADTNDPIVKDVRDRHTADCIMNLTREMDDLLGYDTNKESNEKNIILGKKRSEADVALQNIRVGQKPIEADAASQDSIVAALCRCLKPSRNRNLAT